MPLTIYTALAYAIVKPSVIYKDVAIIGGGASGAYSAVRLRRDHGTSIILIEKEDRLGGHVDTYVDPTTNLGYDYGVQNYLNIGNASAFFQSMNVTVADPTRRILTNSYIDFTTGKMLTAYTPPPNDERVAALQKYLAVAEQWDGIMQPGFWDFPSPDNIPQDLLLPFSAFVTKYNLSAAVPQIFETTGFGVHDLMNSLTMWVLRSFNTDFCRTLLGLQTSFVPASNKNQELYDKILSYLGSDVLLSTTVISSSRPTHADCCVTLRVHSPHGDRTIVAKRLLVAIEPTSANMAPLDLDAEESGVFGAFSYSTTYVGVVTHPSLPINGSLVNTPAAAQPAHWEAAIPASPMQVRFDSYGPSNLFRAILSGDPSLTSQGAQALVDQALGNMLETGVLPNKGVGVEALKWLGFAPHGLVSAQASAEDIRSGFIQRLNALQGHRNTWYTGAAWSVHLTTSVWLFTDTVLPLLVNGL
ncbi:hypothetical protein GQ53DRAFT_876157 [Thozetella sp. PMI_491]|nr:hypothetical protein GQ53DRAFT_876157 [Thozetella sp. PMI_491]